MLTNKFGFAHRALALTGLFAVVGTSGITTVATAQTTKTHRGLLHRHRHIATAAAGVGAYKIAKHTGNKRAANGGHRNIAQRHPFLTGAAAAAATHHHLKK